MLQIYYTDTYIYIICIEENCSFCLINWSNFLYYHLPPITRFLTSPVCLCWGFTGRKLRKACGRGYDLKRLLFWLVCSLWHPRGNFFNPNVFCCNSSLKMFFVTFLFCQLWTFSGNAKRWSPHSHLPQFHVSQQASVQGQSGSGCGQWHGHPMHVCCQSGSQESNRGKLWFTLYRFTLMSVFIKREHIWDINSNFCFH